MQPFVNEKTAIQHLIYHVLTPLECHAWHEVLSRQFEVLDESTESLDACFQMRAKLSEHPETALSEEPIAVVIQAYFTEIDRQRSESEILGWHATIDNVRVALDTSGVVSIRRLQSSMDGVQSAFLPGYGTVQGTVASQITPTDPHARITKRSWMRGDDRARKKDPGQNDIKCRMEQRQSWSNSQRIYYLVFRSVLKTIRSWQGEHKSGVGLESLKQVLPSMSQLKYEQWRYLRTTAGVHHE